MASVTMSQAPSSYSSTTSSSSSQSGFSENDITSKFGRIKFSDGPTLIVCDIDNEACNNSINQKRPINDDSMMMILPSTGKTTTKPVETIEQTNGTVKLSSSHPIKEPIERSPSTSSLSVPSVDFGEKRPPLPDENMMTDESL